MNDQCGITADQNVAPVIPEIFRQGYGQASALHERCHQGQLAGARGCGSNQLQRGDAVLAVIAQRRQEIIAVGGEPRPLFRGS